MLKCLIIGILVLENAIINIGITSTRHFKRAKYQKLYNGYFATKNYSQPLNGNRHAIIDMMYFRFLATLRVVYTQCLEQGLSTMHARVAFFDHLEVVVSRIAVEVSAQAILTSPSVPNR